jgi:hypothetical protein
LIASKYKKTLHGKLKAVKKWCQDVGHTGAAHGSRYYFCKAQLQERTRKAAKFKLLNGLRLPNAPTS